MESLRDLGEFVLGEFEKPNLWNAGFSLDLLLFAVIGLLFLGNSVGDSLMYSVGIKEPAGQYDPLADEIQVNVPEDHEYYKEIQYHEEMHQKIFTGIPVPGVLLNAAFAVGAELAILGFLSLSTRLWKIGGGLLLLHYVANEGVVVALTWIKFQSWSSVSYALSIGWIAALWFVSWMQLTKVRGEI